VPASVPPCTSVPVGAPDGVGARLSVSSTAARVMNDEVVWSPLQTCPSGGPQIWRTVNDECRTAA
jgi:hypothetical protein